MKVEERVRNLSADLGKLAEYYDVILGISKRKPKNLEKFLASKLPPTPTSQTTVLHAVKVNEYCRKHKSMIKKLVKGNKPDKAFFSVARTVFETLESQDAVKTLLAIFAELKASIKFQFDTIRDLTFVEKEEFSHLKEWGLSHDIGRKQKVHVTDFAHKLERRISWKHGNDRHNEKRLEVLVSKEPDLVRRSVHLYIISLIKLKHMYESLELLFKQQLKDIAVQESLVKKASAEHFGSVPFSKNIEQGLAVAKRMGSDLKKEGRVLSSLLEELKEVKYRLSEITVLKEKQQGPFLYVLSDPVQINYLPEKHPHKVRLKELFGTDETVAVLLGGDHNLCHLVLSHASPVTARLVQKGDRYYLFNEKGSDGTFIIRGKLVFALVQDKDDRKILATKMSMPDKKEFYDDLIRKKKLEFKVLSPSRLKFPLQDEDLIVIPPGYVFRYSID